MYKRSLGGRRNVRGILSSQNSSLAVSRSVDKAKTSKLANDDIFSNTGMSSNENAPSSTQTSRASQNGSKSQSKKPANYFEEIISSSGLIFDASGDAFQLSKDQALFVKELECELKSNLTYPKNVDEFMSGFEKYISSSGNLRKALAQTKTSSTCTTARSMQQDSLVRLLLLTAELQPKVAKLMLEKVAEFAFSSVDDMGDDDDEVSWVRLILSQFRLLDFVVDADALSSQLIDIMQVAPESVQQEVIFFMPQIISDDKHQDAAESLSKMLRENFSLTPIVLDVLSQLNIGSALRAQVCEEMLDALRKAPLEFLPSIVAFILSEAETSDLKQVIPRLRLVLDLTASPISKERSAVSQNTQTGTSKNRSSSQSSFEVLTLEAIAVRLKVGAQGQKLFDAWLSSLEAVKCAADHRPLDVLIMIVLLDSVSGVQDGPKERTYRRKVEALLKSKVRSSLLTEDLLVKTFSQHPSALQEHLKAVTAIASLLLSSREMILLNHGAAWLRLSFVHLAEYLRATILGEIIMHAAIGKVDTINVMLQTLRLLSHDHYEKLAPRSALLMGLLEKVEDMDVEQVRQLMDVLCFLAFSKDEHGSRLRSDITILMRKHLSSSNTQLKRKGVISATMVVKHMASLESESQGGIDGASNLRASSCSRDSQNSDDSLVPGSKAFNAMIYIEMVLTTCSCYPEVFGLLFDQLSCMAMDAELDEKFMEWIVKTMSLDLQNSFLVESTSDFDSYSISFEDLPVVIQYGLDTDINNPIALNLTPLVAQREERLGGPRVSFGGKNSERAELPLEMLNPALRLMRILRFRIENGDLSSIDALLGCGVVLPKLLMDKSGNEGSRIVEEFAALSIMEQKTLLSSLLYAINWFRELVNAFAFQKDQELRIKVLKRVMNIVEMQEILIECLPHLPGYAPPPAVFLSPTATPPSFGSVAKSKGTKKRKSKKSKRGIQLTGATGTQDAAEEEEEMDECGGEKGGGKEHKRELILSALSPFFRELDMEIFGVLLSEDLVINPPKKNERLAELGPAELLFLLEDYTLKLEHSLCSSPLITISSFGVGNQAKGMPFPLSSKKKNNFIFYNLDVHETKTIVRSVISLLPFLCKKLEMISEYFQDTIRDFDGVLDNPQMFLGHAPVLERCLQLLLRDIGALVSWNGYSSLGSQGTSFMKEVLSIIGGRLAEGGATQRTRAAMTVNQLAQNCCTYFGQFAEWIVRLPTAVALVSLLHKTTALTDSHDSQREQLVSVCRMFLSREWIGTDGLPETGTGAAVNLGLMMTSFLWGSCFGATGEDSPLSTLHGIIEEVENAADKIKSAKDRLSAFPSVTKSTFHVVYQALATWLVSVVREEEIEVNARTRERGATQASQSLFSQVSATSGPNMDKKLDWWQIAVKCLLSLVKISKMQDSRRNLSILLKKSLLFINLFLYNGMPVLDKALCSHPNKVYAILRELQNSTRFLQHLCCDCKVKGDVGLTSHVPPVKRSLEQLVFRVKDMLLKNNCAVAFWVGNLKNKNLRGEEIVSQHVSQDISLNSEEGSAEEEDEDSEDSSMPTRKTQRGKRKIMSDEEDSEVGSDLE